MPSPTTLFYLTSLTNAGTLNVQNNAQLNFTGTMTNSGTVEPPE